MKKLKFLLLLFTLLFPLTACAQLFAQQTARLADVVIQYHVWYTGAMTCPTSNPNHDWNHWAWSTEGDNPCNFNGGTTWLRDTSTPYYPLIGPYKSDNKEIYRWHIRLAKAAGITAFIVSTFPALATENPIYMANWLSMLQVASEENFKIGLEAWYPYDAPQTATFYTNIKSNIDSAMASPYASALYKVDGLFVVVFPWGFGGHWNTNANLLSNLINVKNAYYMLNGDMGVTEMSTIRSSITNSSKIANIKDYNFVRTTGCELALPDTSDTLATYAANGFYKPMHVFPHFNEVAIQHEPGRSPPRYCLNNNGAELAAALAEADAGAANVVFMDSWNDFFEASAIEPGMDIQAFRNYGQEQRYFGDPYKILKQIAAWKGVEWQTPFLDCAIVDPVLQQKGIVQCGTPITTPPNAPSALALN